CEEAKKLGPVHAGHSKVEGDHVGMVGNECLAELGVVRGDHRFEPALAGGVGKEVRKRRLVIDQQQTRLRQIDLLSSPAIACPAIEHVVKGKKRLFNRTVHKVPFWRDFTVPGDVNPCSHRSSGEKRRYPATAAAKSSSTRLPFP